MATYYTDFGSDTTGVLPASWTHQVVSGTASGTVVADASYTGGKALRLAVTTQGRNGFKWDDIDADADRDDVEILMRVKLADKGSSGTHLGGWGRGSGTTDLNVTGYVPAIQPDRWLYTYYDAGSFGEVAPEFLRSWNTSSWYWMRTRMVGNDLRLRVWADGDAEPDLWDIDTPYFLLSAAGVVGLFVFRTGTFDVDVFSVGTAGDTAPSSGSGLATPAGFTFTKVSGARTLDGSWTAVSGAATYDWEVDRDVGGGAWESFATGSTASTSFQLTSTDGVGWGETYRSRVRAVS